MGSARRPEIPLPVQREVRQRCGFGCVVCGLPLYEYEHMLGWANVHRHVAEEITLLCGQHHREKTGGLLPADDVARANADPYNLREGVSKPYDLRYSGSECEALIGGNRFTTADQGYGTEMVPISIDGIPIVGFILADGHLLMNLNLFDEFNQLVLRIINNELMFKPDTWDIELVGRRLVVREGSRRILVDIVFEVPNRVSIEGGRFLCNGVEVLVRPDYLLVTNNKLLLTGCSAEHCPGGLILGRHDPRSRGFMVVDRLPRYLGDSSEAQKWANEALAGEWSPADNGFDTDNSRPSSHARHEALGASNC